MSGTMPPTPNPDPMAAQLEDFGVPREVPDEQPTGPLYRIDANLRVPVAKSTGTLWKGRISSAKSNIKLEADGWEEAIRYYNNNQQSHRDNAGDNGDVAGNSYYAKRRNKVWTETENIVYSNVQAVLPSVYAKNPQAAFTTDVVELKAYVQLVERLINRICSLRHTPGINLKIHAKQAVVSAEVTNVGWLYYGYTLRSEGGMYAQQQLAELSQQLEAAKDVKDIISIEGKITSLMEDLTLVSEAGPWVRFIPRKDVLIDPRACLPDFSDASWRAVREVYPTSFLQARYGQEKDKDGKVMSVFKPTHVLLGDQDVATDEKNSFRLFDPNAEPSMYGYNDKKQLKNAHQTECWRIYDCVLRRVYLYASNDWEWPVWVDNDPYGLPEFVPLVPIVFNVAPIGNQARSPVTYYLDQQDALNDIHDEMNRARKDLKDNVLFDDSFDREAVSAYLTGANGTAKGVQVPEGKKLTEMIYEKPNNMMKALPLFDPLPIYARIDRLSGTSEVQRSGQYKTNTTNKAIENYNATTASRLDAKIDSIEDAIGELMYGVAFLCCQFMTTEEVAALLGQEAAAAWQNHTAEELRSLLTCQVVGGSTQKPTSAAKKQEAIEVATVLEKFAQFAPTVVLHAVTQMFDAAFTEVELPPDTFERIEQEASASLQQPSSGGPSGAGAGPPSSSKPQGANAGPPQPDPQMMIQQLMQRIDSLPPEAKLALGQALAQGAPVAEALPMVLQAVGGAGGPPTPSPTIQ